MKKVIFLTAIALLAACAANEERNNDLKSEQVSSVSYTEQNYDFDGDIDDLVSNISALATGQAESSYSATITGIVTTAASYQFEWVTSGTTTDPTDHKYINNAFWIQDQNAGIMVFYDEDYDDDGYPDQDYRQAIVSMGDKVTIDVTYVMNYNAAGGMPIVTKFDTASLKVLSTGNEVYYQNKTSAFTTSDMGKVVRTEGATDSTPVYVEYNENLNPMADGTLCDDSHAYTSTSYECDNTTYQAKNQTAFISSIASTWNFQLSVSLVRGTLDSYALADGQYSYNITKGSDVILSGPVFCPKYTGTTTDLAVAVGDKAQVEQ